MGFLKSLTHCSFKSRHCNRVSPHESTNEERLGRPPHPPPPRPPAEPSPRSTVISTASPSDWAHLHSLTPAEFILRPGPSIALARSHPLVSRLLSPHRRSRWATPLTARPTAVVARTSSSCTSVPPAVPPFPRRHIDFLSPFPTLLSAPYSQSAPPSLPPSPTPPPSRREKFAKCTLYAPSL